MGKKYVWEDDGPLLCLYFIISFKWRHLSPFLYQNQSCILTAKNAGICSVFAIRTTNKLIFLEYFSRWFSILWRSHAIEHVSESSNDYHWKSERANVDFYLLRSSANKLILAFNFHPTVQNSFLLMHNYWSPKLQVILMGKWNSAKKLKIFIGFELVTLGTYMSLTGDRWKSSTLINYSVNPKGGIGNYVLKKNPKNQASHSHTLPQYMTCGYPAPSCSINHTPFHSVTQHYTSTNANHPTLPSSFPNKGERMHMNSLQLPKELKMFNGRDVK